MLEHKAWIIRRVVGVTTKHYEYVHKDAGEDGAPLSIWTTDFSKASIMFDYEWADLRARYIAKVGKSMAVCIALTIIENPQQK
jgi:hypothetical protein